MDGGSGGRPWDSSSGSRSAAGDGSPAATLSRTSAQALSAEQTATQSSPGAPPTFVAAGAPPGAPSVAEGLLLRTREGGLCAALCTTLERVSTASIPAAEASGVALGREALEGTLDGMSARGDLFLERFRLLGPQNRRAGGQGVVQFALVAHNGSPVAIKFFANRRAFEREEELYLRDGLRDCMPAISLIERGDEVRVHARHAPHRPSA